MKILYSCLSQSWGGMEMYTITAIKQLLKRNVYVELLCTKESRLHIEANNIGLIIHTLKKPGYFNPFGILKTSLLLRKNNYDLIHTQASKDLWTLVPALKFFNDNTPLILTKHLGSFITKKDSLHKWIYARLDYALAISEVIKNNLMETTPLTENKISLLHNGIDLNKFDPAKADREKIRNEFNIKEDEVFIGMLARFSPGKGHEEFLYAASEVNKIFNNLKFIIVGEASRGEDQYEASIKKLADSYSLRNLIFAGYRSDTVDILSAMDIFIFPSHAEAFGLALAEAMAMGKPTVCSASDGVLDIAVDKETSLLFERKNGKDLAEKLKILIEDPLMRNRFGKEARKRIEKYFDIEVLTDKVIEIYKLALEKK